MLSSLPNHFNQRINMRQYLPLKKKKKDFSSIPHFPLTTASLSLFYFTSILLQSIVSIHFSLIPLLSYSLKLTAIRLLSSSFHGHSSGQVSSELTQPISSILSWNTFFMWLLGPHSLLFSSYLTGPFFPVSLVSLPLSSWYQTVAELQDSVPRPLLYLCSFLGGESLVSWI